ncbi:preprotein translocase subunit SecG [Candidatus Peregrinibacteria bacterium]|nr:preprotein translocase subunit SecG [Candidatus Peregrinibacteria bacterium]
MFQKLAFLSGYVIPAEIVISLILSLLILVQNKEGGLGQAFGGSGGSFQATRRGTEKVIFNATIVFAALFVVVALLIILVP